MKRFAPVFVLMIALFALAPAPAAWANSARFLLVCSNPQPAALPGIGPIGLSLFVNMNTGRYQSLGVILSAGTEGNSALFFVSGGEAFTLQTLQSGKVELATHENGRPLSLVFDRQLLSPGTQGAVAVTGVLGTTRGVQPGVDVGYSGTFTCRAQADVAAIQALSVITR